jgi:hypothetical protein
MTHYIRDLRPAKWGSAIGLHGSNLSTFTSAMGQKQTFRGANVMSALHPKADIRQRSRDVRFVPKADVSRCSKNRL